MRKTGIGGSEIAAIMGVDPYSSPYQVYLAKVKGEQSYENKFTEAGHILEDAIAKFFAKRTGYKIIQASSENEIYRHPVHDFVIGSPDRRYIVDDERVLECKNTIIHREEVPLTWFAQLQWYLGLLGLDSGAIAWLEQGVDFSYEEYEFDEDMFLFMVEKAERFWKDHVLRKIPPDPICVEDVELMHPIHTPKKVMEAGRSVFDHYEKIKQLKDMIKMADEMKRGLEDEVKMCFGDAEGIAYNGRLLFTWKTPKPSMYFDTTRFKEEHPDLYEQFLKPKESSRRFLPK